MQLAARSYCAASSLAALAAGQSIELLPSFSAELDGFRARPEQSSGFSLGSGCRPARSQQEQQAPPLPSAGQQLGFLQVLQQVWHLLRHIE
jgi:hypothetical protein